MKETKNLKNKKLSKNYTKMKGVTKIYKWHFWSYSMKKEETDDILHYLYPRLREVDIDISQCKQDTTTKKTLNRRGDVWISKVKFDNQKFEKNIVALIEAKHRNCKLNDKEWEIAKEHGKTKSLNHNLNFYIITNTKDTIRFYNSHNNTELSINGEIISQFQRIDVLIKLNSIITKETSNFDTKKVKIIINEKDFRNSLRELDNIYRTVKLDSNEKINSTISFMIIKYISDKEEEEWSFTVPREDKIISLWNDFKGNYKNCFENSIKNFLSGDYGDEYSDFKKIVKFSTKLINDNFEKIYEELKNYELHGADFDLFGVIYETFADSGEKKKFGEYYTRRHITKSISRLLLYNETNYRNSLKICDCCCGTGGFLTEAFKVLRDNWAREGNLSRTNENHLKYDIFYGYDDRDESIARAELNMFLVGDGHTNIKKRDTLKQFDGNDGLEEEEYDYILSNPPYGQYKGSEKIEDFWSNEKRTEMLFIEKIIRATKRGGRMAIVVPDGVLEAPSREYFRIDMLHKAEIEMIISLPKFAFAPYTKEKTYVLFMKRKQKENEGKIQNTPIWHYIVDYDGYANSDKRYETRLQNDKGEYLHYDLPHLETSFRDKLETYIKINGVKLSKSKEIPMSEVKVENFHNLLCEFYLRPVEVETITEKDFNDKLNNILKQI